MNGYPAELQKRLEENCREERAQARLLIALGIPFAAAAIFGMTFALSALFWLLRLPYLWASFLAFILVSGAVAFDTWKHPSEQWTIARYYLAGTINPQGDPKAVTLVAADGIFAGMPMMASVSDPANLAEHGGMLLRGCSNVILGGPRNIRKGIEQLRAVQAKSDPKVESAAVRFLAWLKKEQPVTEEEVAGLVGKDPSLRQGFSLASELGFLRRRKEGPQRLLEMKEPSMREDVS
jgi:hypothetical protein